MALRTLLARSGIQLKWNPALATTSLAQNGLQRFFATVQDDRKYAESHEWAQVDGDNATVGISDFAQLQLGDVVYVELPEVGTEVKQGEVFGVVESVKAASDVYSPVSGEVTEVNSSLVDDSSLVNESPYDDGWFMKVKVTDKGSLNSLMESKAYEEHCAKADDH
mmetsp:Transcript_14112/g.42602  ORF Transcript_14112/g.42602 Transcript_14112/m.42602 type:complete len:165 (-) Transcript_14112:309-803(-)|eukprot:CAMPEP_0206149196 /NCGR_PEP_ID=MMETSP1473-20131121/37652_1 /ASSEMBLY_ACC=CAM_ASM_001109 /TAXON_ID=1461547 /ORGANISM="Stichococcus sp, Strain RCC1054" /LENGTH=164 /DNA_ID=CAMNT_0053546647 /DNA_START=487 /DNA_END=981 /DNA_ORIENTATION=+